jgi:hypothetical protein
MEMNELICKKTICFNTGLYNCRTYTKGNKYKYNKNDIMAFVYSDEGDRLGYTFGLTYLYSNRLWDYFETKVETRKRKLNELVKKV